MGRAGLRIALTCAALVLATAQPAYSARPTPVSIPSGDETAPVAHSGDAADDPAIWVDQADPARSLVIGNDKKGALESSTALYAIVIARAGESRTRQHELTDADSDGLLAGTLRRTFYVGSEAEACAVDDQGAALYVPQEDVGLWRYGANPTGGSARVAVDRVVSAGGRLAPGIEGVTVAGNRIIVSAQSTRAVSSSARTERTSRRPGDRTSSVSAGQSFPDGSSTDSQRPVIERTSSPASSCSSVSSPRSTKPRSSTA